MGNAAGKNYVPKHSGTGSSAKKVHWGSAALPASPGKPILIAGSTEETQPDIVGIRWERSVNNGGSAIIGYQVEHRRLGSPYWVRSSPTLCTFPELTLSGLEPGWRYQFRVKARNGLGLSEPSELSDPLTVTLQRSAASAPKFDIELKDTVALENEQAEFTVQFSGAPLPKISWFKDGFEIFSSRRTRIITENGKSQLLIHQTALNDEGEIKCTATNRAGHVGTKAKLILEAPPKIRLPRQYEDGLLFEQGETIRLKVSLAGRPLPTVTWYHDGDVVLADLGHIFEQSDGGESALKISVAQRKDRGEYTVKAFNKLGEDVASFLVTVTDRPAAPGKAQIAMTLGRSVTLAWAEPDDDGGCKIGTYIVEYYRIGWDMWLKAATCRQSTTILGELIEGSEYRFRVKAENPYGVSDPSEESDIVFIPDPKRGITTPPKRPDKSQSQYEIRRSRGSERRDDHFSEPTKRTRSLTREEASRGVPRDGFEAGPPTRSASAHRLPSGPVPPSRPSRADSRVTFADTVFLHVEKPLEDPSSIPTRPKTKRDKKPNVEENVQLSSPNQDKIQTGLEKMESLPKIVKQPSFDDSSGRKTPEENLGRREKNTIREKTKSPSPPRSIKIQDNVNARRTESLKKQASSFESTSPRESLDLEDDEEARSLRGSSEFMLVLYPDEDSNAKNARETMPGNRRNSEGGYVEEMEEDLVAPPMSLSLPELFSINHEVVEVLREAVSSTELLHERAMERFYRAVALEEAEMAKQNNNNNNNNNKRERSSPMTIDGSGLSSGSMRLRNTRLRRRPSSGGSPPRVNPGGSTANAAAWNRRRSSEGQTMTTKILPGLPASLLLPTPELVASDPNLPNKHEIEITEAESKASFDPTMKIPSANNRSALHHWDEKSMPLVPDAEDPEKAGSDVRPPETILNRAEELFEEEFEEELEEEQEVEESEEEELSSDEDLKLLKSRILAQPIVDEEDTYHPRGMPIAHVPSPEPVSPPAEIRAAVPNNNINNNTVTQPKSILKKRPEQEEAIPVNRFGRPIPPEVPISETDQHRKRMSGGNGGTIEIPSSNNGVVMRRKSLTGSSEAMRILSDVDKENATVLSTGEVARNRRGLPAQNPPLPTKSSFEEEEEHEARMAVIDHYTEIVREYSMAHSAFPPRSGKQLPPSSQETIRKKNDSTDTRMNSPIPIISRGVSKKQEGEEDEVRPGNRSRKSSVGSSRGTTPSKEIQEETARRSPRRKSRNDSPGRRSRNVSKERSSSRTRNSGATTGKSRINSRESSREPSVIPSSRSSSKTRERERSRERPKSQKERSRQSSRANSKERHQRRTVEASPSDSETSVPRTRLNKYESRKLETTGPPSRSGRASSGGVLDDDAQNGLERVLAADAAFNNNVRSTISYATDLTLLLAAIYVYIFKKEILAIPLIGLLLYRRIQQDIHSWLPKWWNAKSKR